MQKKDKGNLIEMFHRGNWVVNDNWYAHKPGRRQFVQDEEKDGTSIGWGGNSVVEE